MSLSLKNFAQQAAVEIWVAHRVAVIVLRVAAGFDGDFRCDRIGAMREWGDDQQPRLVPGEAVFSSRPDRSSSVCQYLERIAEPTGKVGQKVRRQNFFALPCGSDTHRERDFWRSIPAGPHSGSVAAKLHLRQMKSQSPSHAAVGA